MARKEKPKRSGLEGILQTVVVGSRPAEKEIEEILPARRTAPDVAPWDAEELPVRVEALPVRAEALPVRAEALPAASSRPVGRTSRPGFPPEKTAAPEPQTALDQIRTARLKTPRTDRRKREPVVSYRGIPEALQSNLDELADERDLPVGVLARFFLEHGLAESSAGTLQLAPQLVRVGLTLYPEPAESAPRRRRRPASGRNNATHRPLRPVAFRGIPQETARAVAELANRLGVPIGEVARFFLETGIRQVRSGELELQTYPLPSTLRTLYPAD